MSCSTLLLPNGLFGSSPIPPYSELSSRRLSKKAVASFSRSRGSRTSPTVSSLFLGKFLDPYRRGCGGLPGMAAGFAEMLPMRLRRRRPLAAVDVLDVALRTVEHHGDRGLGLLVHDPEQLLHGDALAARRRRADVSAGAVFQ